jgi:hypothetical protein
MAQGLRGSAAQFAQSALEGFLREDYPLFFVHAATASEQIGKAVLAATHPTLIVDPRSTESLLYAAGAAARPPRLRTIAFREVLDRLFRVAPAMTEFRDEVTILADVRNGVVHLGQEGEGAVARRVLVPLIRFADACLARLREEPEAFWPWSLLDQRRHWLSEYEEKDKVRLQEQIAAARLRFEERFGAFPNADREAMAEILIEGADVYGEETQRVSCPACSSWAVLHGALAVEGAPEYSREGGSSPSPTTASSRLTPSGVRRVALNWPGSPMCLRRASVTTTGSNSQTASWRHTSTSQRRPGGSKPHRGGPSEPPRLSNH